MSQLFSLSICNALVLSYKQTKDTKDTKMKREPMTPWYLNPATIRKVLDRIANQHACVPLRDLNELLGQAADRLWSKQEKYYTKDRHGHSVAYGPESVMPS